MKGKEIVLYDTTLRDGAQGEGISFSLRDKLAIAEKLDELGIDYIEGGWPGSNPKDMEFFKEAQRLDLKHARIAAFGSTCRKGLQPSQDTNILALLETGCEAIAIFGKSWMLHVLDVLKVEPEDNISMIRDSISFLKEHGKTVFFDADNADYALRTLEAACEGGADALVLCDTNGGTITSEIAEITSVVASKFPDKAIGIHAHNDAGLAVANSIAAVQAGARHVQGTMNGFGERCGNADLCVIIPNLQLKLNFKCVEQEQLHKLVEVSRFVCEIANMVPQTNQPYVGSSAFAHKGGIHVDAVRKNPRSYEHIAPEAVGNVRRILVSELSGTGTILYKLQEMGFDLSKRDPETIKILQLVKEMERDGYHFEAADASLELLIRKTLGKDKKFFDLEGFRVSVEKREDERLISEATIKLKVKGELEHTAAEGDGPVHALDNALRKALLRFYPCLAEMHLTDFKVRVLDAKSGTAAKVRVLIESQDKESTWCTVGVSVNIIEASWQALVDSVVYKLYKEGCEGDESDAGTAS